MTPELISIPTTDSTFRRFVSHAVARSQPGSPEDLERRLRRTYPRVIVRERGLAGEVPAWYVYRDGVWRAPDRESWWTDPDVPRVEANADGWIEHVNPAAAGLLGLEQASAEPRHFTDFVVPGGLDDAVALFEIVQATGSLEATLVLRPTTGDSIAVDLRVSARPDGIVGIFKLAGDVDVPPTQPVSSPPEQIDFVPATDAAFRAYAARSLARMPEPTADGLALRLRRLYPHAQVDATADGWIVRRDRDTGNRGADEWWHAADLPLVRYDALGLILEANDAAAAFFGRSLIGLHWQDFVTAGSTDEVEVMLSILGLLGAAESRFRIPRGDGDLLEFDSYTVVEGDRFSSVFRPATPVAALSG